MQGLFNSRGLQNLGLDAAVREGRRRESAPEGNTPPARYAPYFNTNPNFAPLVAGGVIRIEDDRGAGNPVADNEIESFKRTMASPLAAMGDMLFIGALRPLALTLACVFAIYKSPLGLLAIFLLYNLAIISCRLWGIYFGYAMGWKLAERFSGPEFQRVLGIVQGLGAGAGGLLVGIILNRLPQSGQWMLPAGVSIVALTVFYLRRNVPAAWLAILLYPAVLVATVLVG